MASQIKLRRGTASQWTNANPVLSEGEIGFEVDTSKFKIGNGSGLWSELEYFVNVSDIDALPSQTGNQGKFLTTDGSSASWQTVTTDPTNDIMKSTLFFGGTN